MATRKQKEKLMQTLKFTPRNITISLSGYGGEIVVGRVDLATAQYWLGRDDFEEYATSWSAEEDFADVPEQYRFISEGSWYEIDELAHASGVEMSVGCWLTVQDQLTGENILETELDPEVLESLGISVEEWESVSAEPDAGQARFVGQNFEKGLFFETEIEIDQPFDPAELAFNYSTYDGWRVCNGVSYRGEELDGQDAYSTMGKSSSFQLYVNEDEPDLFDQPEITNIEVLEGEETQAQRLIDTTPKRTLNPNAVWPFPTVDK